MYVHIKITKILINIELQTQCFSLFLNARDLIVRILKSKSLI